MGAIVKLRCDECGKEIEAQFKTGRKSGNLKILRPPGWVRTHDGFGDVRGEYFCSETCADTNIARHNAERERRQA